MFISSVVINFNQIQLLSVLVAHSHLMFFHSFCDEKFYHTTKLSNLFLELNEY